MPPPKVAKIPDRVNPLQPMFVTWNDAKSKQIALTNAAQASQEYGAVVSQRATASNIFFNTGYNTSVRDGMMRRDWDYFRPEEATPKGIRNIIYACNAAYKRVGIVHNIVDVMGEFTCQGIQLIHPDKQIEKLYQEWAKKVNLVERAERFCNYLYRTANVLVQRETAIVKDSDVQNLKRGLAAEQVIAEPDRIELPMKVRKGEIPWEYTFINPLAVEILGGEDLAQFVGYATYGLPIPNKIYNKIRTPQNAEERYLVSLLPDYIVTAARNGLKTIPLDPNKVQSFHYKKDDWQVWAEPMTYAIIDDLILYTKMKLADLAALDGAISHIRLWKLGNLEYEIIPTPAAIARLAEILVNNTSVGAVDLIWGPELELQETSTEVHRFLGSDKYESTISAIYDGLGVPSSLRSTSGGGRGKGGMVSYLSLKVMMERLKYGRGILNSFLQPELVMIQKALGFRFPAQIKYDYMVLSDEAAFLRLLIDLADRDLISVETIQEAFGNIPEIEDLRIRREHQRRDRGKMVKKAGPFHNPGTEDDLLKIFAQTGLITPSEAGLELDEKDSKQQSIQDYKLKQIKAKPAPAPFGGGGQGNPNGRPRPTAPAGQSGQGRPPGKRDTNKRKQRALKPAKAASFFTTRAWARNVQADISKIINPVFLAKAEKDSVRNLTDEEATQLENFKFAVLCNLAPYTEFDEAKLNEMVNNPLPVPDLVNKMMGATLAKFSEKFGRTPTIDEQRLFQAEVYSLYIEADTDTEENSDG